MLKAVLFDHDGTIVDSEIIHYQLNMEILKEYGVHMTYDDYILSYEGLPLPEKVASIISTYQINESPDELERKKRALTMQFLQTSAFPLIPGTSELFNFLKQRQVKIGIVTGALRQEGVLETIDKYELSGLVDILVSADDVQNSKPAPDCYELAVAQLGLTSEECIAIEDSVFGAMSAKSAGLRCIGVNERIDKNSRLGEIAGHHCRNLAEVKQWIEENYF